MLEAVFFGLDPRLLGLIVLIVLFLATEAGFRLGRPYAGQIESSQRSQATTLQAAILGFLALVLSFTYSGSYNRFDTRRQLVIQEANAIETTYLRAGTMPEKMRERTRALLRDYVITRTPTPMPKAVERAIAKAERLHEALWKQAEQFSRSGADPARKTLFISSLNETIDLHTSRVAAYLYRAPPALLFVLHVGAVIAVLFMGYVTGLDNRRFYIGLGAMVVLITILLTVIVDLENARMGFITASQQPLLDVQENIGAVGPEGPPRGFQPGSRLPGTE
ncbi:hypothetical protein [Thiohalorhabdus methylotrophus]|uniref:DUF4239 domain-containing protein n=1 Tax=Thiohalorhabdus methylotrophus TaxID=3242694 RepID=A0ABV4TTN4_9GAMM